MFLTAELVFTIFMLAAEKHKGTFIAPIGIGLALFIAELAGVFFVGGKRRSIRATFLTVCTSDWWLSQPCPIVWTLRRPRQVPRLPLE